MNESERSLAVNAGTWVPTDALPGERHERAHLLFESNSRGPGASTSTPSAVRTRRPSASSTCSAATSTGRSRGDPRGGAFNTPQLLRLSGIGPREELEEHGIPVQVDPAPENLQDRYEVGVVSKMERDFALLRDASFKPPGPGVRADRAFDEWRTGQGVHSSNGVVVGIIKSSSRAEKGADLFMCGLPASFTGDYPGYSKALTQDKRHFMWAILKAHTRNRAGTVRLRNGDPRDVPEINFRYFDEGSEGGHADLEAMAGGVEFVRRLMRHSSEYLADEVSPSVGVGTREEIKAFVREQAWGHHASCTCRMGRPEGDEGAVVDGRFQVIGVDGLRIVDASVLPRIPGCFIVTSVFMLSEKASEVILSDAERSRL